MIIPDVNLLVFAYDSQDFLRFPGIRWHNPLTGKTRST